MMTINRVLNSIGKAIFIKYYYKFKNCNRDFCISSLEENFTDKAKSSRTGHAQSIFRNELEEEALLIIAASNRVDSVTSSTAKQILSNDFHFKNKYCTQNTKS